MLRGRRVAILLLLAGFAFLVAAVLNEPWQPLSFIAAGALMFAGVLRFLRSRRTKGGSGEGT
jgi:Flp pilus assembly protein TadB